MLDTRLSQGLNVQISRIKGLTTKESIEIEEAIDIPGFKQFWQIDLIEVIQLMGGLLLVESPEATIGQDAPIETCMFYIRGDLIGWVFIGEKNIPLTFDGDIERAIPGFGLPNGNRPTCQQRIIEYLVFICFFCCIIPIKDVIGYFAAIRRGEGSLYRNGMTKPPEHWLDPIL